MRALYPLGAALVLVTSAFYLLADADAERVHFVLPPDAIPAIADPGFVAASDAYPAPDGLVIGLALGGEAKAYPVSVLNWHEVVDDTVGGRPVAVTWCPLCFTAMVFDREVQGRTLTFRVSGKLYRNNLVMYDVETGSLWSQEAARAIAGPLEGAELRLLPSELAPWAAWREQHPGSLVLEPPGLRNYGSDPYLGYATSPDTLYPVARPDARLPAKALVYGLRAGGEAKAYPFDVLRREGVVNDAIGGVAVVLT